MRLMFLSNVYPSPVLPGKGTFNQHLVRALAKRHAVRVVCPISWVDEWRASRQGRTVPRGRVAADGEVIAHYPRFWYPPKILHHRFDRFLQWSIGRELDQACREFQPDAMIAYWLHPDAAVAVSAARKRGIPAVVMTGGSDLLLLARGGARRREIVRVLHAADAVVAVSQHLAEQIEAAGVPARRVHVVYRGVDRSVFGPGDQAAARQRLGLHGVRPVLLTVGRLVPVKGLDVLVGACDRLAREGLDFACYVLGEGPLAGPLAAQIASAGLEGHVRLVGGRTRRELRDWYQAADLAVLASYSEGIPNVLLEAVCCGLPFVATRVGGIPEIARNCEDQLVAPGEAEALAAGIRRGLSERARVSDFVPWSWGDSAAALAGVVAEVTGSTRACGTECDKDPAQITASQQDGCEETGARADEHRGRYCAVS